MNNINRALVKQIDRSKIMNLHDMVKEYLPKEKKLNPDVTYLNDTNPLIKQAKAIAHNQCRSDFIECLKGLSVSEDKIVESLIGLWEIPLGKRGYKLSKKYAKAICNSNILTQDLPHKCPECPAKDWEAVLDENGVCPVCKTRVTKDKGGKTC